MYRLQKQAWIAALAFACLLWTGQSYADDEDDLAKKLSNPVASLISVPFQYNYDGRMGPLHDGSRMTLNIQPVVPISLNNEWNLISRTVVPLIRQVNIGLNTGEQAGLGDIEQSFLLSPAKPGDSGIIWGVGPVLMLPTGTDKLLTQHQWGAGPTAVVLKQFGGWTIGVFGNHIWSYANTVTYAPSVNQTFFQPFISYTTADKWTFGLNAESTYDWQRKDWTLPINASVGKLLKLGSQPISLTFGLRYYAASPYSGPKGLGARVQLVFLFPE